MTEGINTARLQLRPVRTDDAAFILEMDRDPLVLRYLASEPISTLEQAQSVIAYIQKQYADNGTGRWAVVRREDGAFLGWCGIKLVNDGVTGGRTGYYDIGYRFLSRYWGQGYALEAAVSCMQYAFGEMKLHALHATIMDGNTASVRIAEKLGFRHEYSFTEDGQLWHWYRRDAS